MGELLLSELIEQTKVSVRSFEHSRSTDYQYEMAWSALTAYFVEKQRDEFSKPLAQQFVLEFKAKWEAGVIKIWRYKLYRLAIRLLIDFSEQGQLTWNYQKHIPANQIYQSAYIVMQKEFLNRLQKEGKGSRTIELYEIVSRQFLVYLEEKKIQVIAEIQLDDVRLFIPFISKHYQPTSMRTVFSALRSFLRFVESKDLTPICLSRAIPTSFGRKTTIIPTFTLEEEQKLLGAVDRTTPVGKRNYAMLLLALRTGLRSIDIVNLKLKDIHWKNNTIEIVQEKTDTPLVLPLLADVGNAIADYILNGRPGSPSPISFYALRHPIKTWQAGQAVMESAARS